MKDQIRTDCPECDGLDRRDFVRTLAVGGAALAAGGLPSPRASPSPASVPRCPASSTPWPKTSSRNCTPA